MSYSSKTIAKNMGFLYIRTIIIILISLYTSRVFLDALGVLEFGIYSAVGGVVGMISFLNSSLSSATSRYLTFELGKGNLKRLKKTFQVSISVHIILIICILLILETIGLWFINNKLNIPDKSITIVNSVYQLSVLSCVFQILVIPFNATIIAHEKLNVFAIIGVMDAVLKLIIAFAIYYSPIDKLLLYSSLLLGITMIDAIVYIGYCKLKFTECSLSLCFDKEILTPMLVYSGWGFYGNFSVVVRNQGLVLLQNSFFGPIVNAATTISNQVMSAIMGFADNFVTAVNPQIVKLYAQEANEDFNNLIIKASKYSFFMLFMISMPVFFEAKFLLNLWLIEVPEWTVIFCQLSIINNWISILYRPILTAISATGYAKRISLTNGSIYLLVLPLSYIFLKAGGSPVFPFILNIILLLIGHTFGTLSIIKIQIPTFSLKEFIKQALVPSLIVMTVSSIPYFILNRIEEVDFVIRFIISILWVLLVILFIGLNRNEREQFTLYIKMILLKFRIIKK